MSELINILKAKKSCAICQAMIVITLFSSYSSKTHELQAKRTVIAGKVVNMLENSTVLLVNFCNPLSDESRFSQDLTVSAGAFHVAHDYVFAQNLTIRYDNFFINFYIAPGDSVFLTIDGSKLQQRQNNAVAFSNISGFPGYMLIDKKGQFRYPVAKPSNMPSVIKQIDSLLSQ